MWAFRLEHRKDHPKGKGLHRKLTISEWLDITMEKDTGSKCPSCNGAQVKNFTINEERIIVFYGRAIRAIRDTLSVTRFRLSQNSERRW